MLQVLRSLKSPFDLKAVGFQTTFSHSSEEAAALDTQSPSYQTQMELAKLMWTGAVQIVRFRTLSHMHYVGTPPAIFAGLLHPL